MATTKKSTKVQPADARPAGTFKPQSAEAELGPNEIRIKFHHPHQVLPKLLELAQHFADDHIQQLGASAAPEDVLGGARARMIVSLCANSTAWLATLGELGLNLLIFRNCVAAGVDKAGYKPPANIPASSDTRLVDVLAVIQGAQHK